MPVITALRYLLADNPYSTCLHLTYRSPELTSGVLLVLYILHELGVHSVNGHEQCLYGRVVGDAPSPLLVTPHTVTEDLDARTQRVQELGLIFIYLAILVALQVR